MQSPTTARPGRREQDLIVVPDARPRRRWGLIAAIVAGALVALLAAGAIGYSISQDQADERIAVIESNATLSQQRAAADLATVGQQVETLDQQVAVLTARNAELQASNEVINASRREVRALLDQARAQADAAQANARSLAGPGVSDGTHITRVVAVGPAQVPGRLVVQIDRWFTGRAARVAAIRDGAIPPGGRLPNHRYLRKGTGTWRIVSVDPSATAVIRDGRPGIGARTVSMTEFERILRLDSRWARRIAHDPFWITVTDGTVRSMQQQPYP
jgi:hypothetical protein